MGPTEKKLGPSTWYHVPNGALKIQKKNEILGSCSDLGLVKDRVLNLKSDFWVPGFSQKMGLRPVEHGFSSFFAKYLAAYLMIQSL